MKNASDFRTTARNALTGKWTIAVLAGLIASLLGAVHSGGPGIEFHFEEGRPSLEIAGQELFSGGGINAPLAQGLLVGAGVLVTISLITIIAVIILGSIVSVGYSRFNMDLIDRQKTPEVNSLFGYFKHWRSTAVAGLLQALFIFLWSLLFLIPGIMAAYSYSMTKYILAENPQLSPSEAIERSKQLMLGNRFRLFCLQLSFIGWDILCAFTLGIGYLWLTPYKQAAEAAFYREISGTSPAAENPWQNQI